MALDRILGAVRPDNAGEEKLGREEEAASHPERRDAWMAYTTSEVSAACGEKGWRWQIRRKWSVRETPVTDSPIDDFQW